MFRLILHFILHFSLREEKTKLKPYVWHEAVVLAEKVQYNIIQYRISYEYFIHVSNTKPLEMKKFHHEYKLFVSLQELRSKLYIHIPLCINGRRCDSGLWWSHNALWAMSFSKCDSVLATLAPPTPAPSMECLKNI